MVGLKGCRVIVVDDEFDDALPILKALAKNGISAAFFTGSVEEVPPEDQRLYGVRLAILDMDLTGGGTEDKTKVATLLNVIRKILHPRNGPYAIVAWTKHAELLSMFDERLFSMDDIPKPIVTLKIEKSDCKSNGHFDLAIVSAKLKEALVKFSPLLFLEAWEEKCYAAATDVTNALSELANPGMQTPDAWRDMWKVQLLQLMHAMAAAEAGKSLVDSESALAALYASLNPLHSDRMENSCADLSEEVKSCSGELMTDESSRDCGSIRKAKINSMLHVASDRLDQFRCGNVYRLTDLIAGGISVDDLLKDLVNGNPEEVKAVATPILIEVNPTCDHAQNNIRLARLVAGLIVPISTHSKIKGKGEFILHFGPLVIESGDLQGECWIVANSRFLASTDLHTVKEARAVLRLRHQVITYLQAWLSAHASRPGVLSL